MDSLGGSDLQMEMAEKEKMLEQLKVMVRDKDEVIRKKDSELQESKASLSKFKLQSKAKLNKLNHQLEEAKKAALPDNGSDKSSECGEELPSEQANRAKMKLLRRKLEEKDRQMTEKDEQLASRDQQMVAKEKVIEERNQVIQQREEMIRTITNQLHERDKIINDMGQSEKQPSREQIDQIYAQILYKDKLIVDLNNKILELDRKIIDLQEFAGEKDEVIKGRDKVIQVLQTSIVEKDQNVTSQSALIKKLTSKVEANEENLSLLTEKLEKAEHSLKVESERFNLRLTETQKYFEETLGERESEISQLHVIIRERDKDVATRDNDLRELLLRHEQDLQEIMSGGEGSMHDHVVKMLEQKLKDINGVLDSKVQVIEVMTNDVAAKDRQLLITGNTVKALKEKLAVSSEQNLLLQQTFADFEMQWKEERSKLEMRLRASAEKLEEERGELNLQLHTLGLSLRQYEAAYSQAAVQYNALQERYQQAYLEVQALKAAPSAMGSPTPADQPQPSTDHSELLKKLEGEMALNKKLEEQVHSQEEEISKLRNLQGSGSFSEKTASDEKNSGSSSKQRQSPEKSSVSSKVGSKAGDKQKSATDSPGSKANDAKLLKLKAQYTAKIKTLEKEVEELKKSGGGGGPVPPDVETLQNRLAEVEEEKGNLMLHLVDFDDTRALQGQLEQQLSDMQKQNQCLQDETQQLEQQLQQAQLEISYLLERITQMQQADEQVRSQFASEKASLLANEEAQKDQMKTELNQLQEECNRLTNQLQEDAKQRDTLHKRLQDTESSISELRAQVQASDAAVEELQKNLVERSEQTFKLSGEKVGLEVRAAELEEIRDELEKEKSDLLTKMESLQNRIEFEKQPNIAFEKETQNLQSKIQELKEDISKEKGISKAQKDQMNELLPKLQQLETEKQQTEEERNQLEEQLMTLRKEKEETDALLQETKLVLESLRTDKQQGEESVNKILREADKEKEDLQNKLANASSALEQQTQEIGHICKALELEHISVHQLSTAVQNRISSIADLRTKLENAEQELSGVQEIVTKREAELKSLKSQVNNYKKQIETSMQNMTEECDSYKENLLTKDQTIQLLQETVESQNNEMQKFHELQKARDQILSSLELKVEEYESNTLEKAKEHNAKVQSLQDEVKSLQKELDSRTQELGGMGSKQTLLAKDLETKDAALHKLKMQHASKTSETDRLLTEMDNEMKAVKSELQEKAAAITKQHAENEEQARLFHAKISQLQDENSAKDAKIESLSGSLSEFSDKCSEFSNLHNSTKTEKDNLAQQLQEYQIVEETARGLLTEQQLQMVTSESGGQQPQMRNYIAHISGQLQELIAIKSQMESSLLESNRQNEILKNKIRDLEILCSEKDSQLLNMKSDSSQHQTMVQGLVEERDQKISSLHQELDRINVLVEEKRVEESKTQSQLMNLQEHLLMKDNELSNVNSQLEMARQHQAGIEDELNTLREQALSKEMANAALQASVAEQQQKVSDLSENFQLALHEKETLHVEMVNVRNELMLVTNTNSGLTKDVDDAKQALSERERALDELSSDFEVQKNHSKAELENRESKIKELEKWYAESQSKLSEFSSTVKTLKNKVKETEKKSKQLLREKKEADSRIEKMSQELIQKEAERQHRDEAHILLTDERNALKEQLAVTCQSVSDRDVIIEEITKANSSISEELKGSLTHLETVTEEKNRWEEKAVDALRNVAAIEADILKMKAESEERELQTAKELQLHSEELQVSGSDAQRLQIEIETLSTELKSEQVKSQEKAAELAKLQGNLEESNEKKEELIKEIELLRLEKHECDLVLNNFKATQQEKEDLVQNLMLALDESKGLKEKTEGEQMAILQEKESVLETVMCENKELRQEKEELAIKIGAFADEKDLMMKKLDGFKKMESEKKAQTSKLEKERDTLKTKLKESVAKVQSTSSKLKKAVSEKSALDAKLKENVSEKEMLRSQMEEAVSEREVLNAKLEEASSEKESLNAKLEGALSVKESLAVKLKDAEQEKAVLDVKVTEQESEKASLSKEIALENEQLKSRLTSTELDLVKASGENEELLKELSAAKSEFSSFEEEKRKLDGLKIQLNAALEENDALRAENKDLNSSLEQSIHEKEIVADELAQVDMKLVATIQEKTKTRNHLDQLMREHNKCADMEPRLEKALRDKRLLSEELSEVDGKLVQILADKDTMSIQLAEAEHRIEEITFEKQEVYLSNEQLSEELAEQKASIKAVAEQEEMPDISALMEEISVQKVTIEKLETELELKVAGIKSLENKETEMLSHNEHLMKTLKEQGALEGEKSELLAKAAELEEKVLSSEAEICRLTTLYSEQACESEQLLQTKSQEVVHLSEALVEKTNEASAAQSEINELRHREASLEKEMHLLSSISNTHTKAFEELREFLVKRLDPLLDVLIGSDGGSGGGDHSCVNGVVPPSEEATTQVDAEKGHKAPVGTDLVFANLDTLKVQVSEKLAKIEHWQLKVMENGQSDRSGLEKCLQELEQSQKQQESQSKLVKKLAQSLKKVKAELSEKGKALEMAGQEKKELEESLSEQWKEIEVSLSEKDKALEQANQQRKELEASLVKDRSKIKQAEDDVRNFLMSSFSPDVKSFSGVESDESATPEIELFSVIEDLKSKVTVAIRESDGRISDLNSLLQTQKDHVACLEKTISMANSTASAKVELSQELQEKYSESCRQLEEMQTKMAELTEEFGATQKENSQLMQVSRKLKESRTQKMADIEELKKQLIGVKQENQSLSEKFHSVIKELEEKVNIETSARTNVEEQMSKLKEEFDHKHLESVSLKEFCETLKTDHGETSRKLNEEIATMLSEIKVLNESFENSKESCLLLEKELSESNSEIALLKNSLKEAEGCAAKLEMDTEAKELKISSLNEATQIMRLELEKCYDELQKKCSDSDTAAKENHEVRQRLGDLNSSLFRSLNVIRDDIQKEIVNSKSRMKPSVAEDLKDIINKSDDLEKSMMSSVNSGSASITDDMCLLEERQPESGLEFLKWLREYLANLWSVQEKDYANAQNIVFELNAVVTSKEETNQDLMDKIDTMMVERRKMSERISSLKNICDDQKSSINTHSSKVQKMKQSMEVASYEIFEMLTSVKTANSSSLSTIVEEEESEADEDNEGGFDVPDATAGERDPEESIPHQLDALQKLAKQVTLLIEAFSRMDSLRSAQDKEILELRERLKAFEDQQWQEMFQKKKKSSSFLGDKQVADSTEVLKLEGHMADVAFDKTDAPQEEAVVQEEQNVSCQSQQSECLQAELDTMSKELVKAKQEMTERLTASQKHAEDLEKRLSLENERAAFTESQLQEVQNQLTTVQSQLEIANMNIHQLQSSSSDLAQGREVDVGVFKEQLERREEQLQNLSLQLADLLQNNDEQEVKLAKKDEKMMSLLENMQELEEQLTSLGNQREADIAKLSSELAEKTAALEETEKSLKTKEAQYLKVLATAKKLKQQGEAAKKDASQAMSQLKELQDKISAESSTSDPDQTASQDKSSDFAQKEMQTVIDMDTKSSERLQELTTQVESFSEYCQQLQLQVQTLTEKLHTAEQLASTQQMQLESLQAVSDEKGYLAASQNELLEGFETKLAALQDEKETLANVVVGKEELIQTLRDRVEDLDRKLNSIETETEKDARISFLNEQLDETSKTMHSLQEEISLREVKLQESKQVELRTKNEYEKVVEQMTEQLKKVEQFGKAKHDISEQLASQIFDLSEQLQAKSVRVEELSSMLKSSEEKIGQFEVKLAEKESSVVEFKQQLQTAGDAGEKLVEELKSLKDLYNTNQEQLMAQQKEFVIKEKELLDVQKELDNLKDLLLQKEDLLKDYQQQLENQKSTETVPETSVQTSLNSEPEAILAVEEGNADQTIIEFPEPDFSGMYESLKLEFDLVFSEKERLSFENFELKKLLTDAQHDEEEVLLKQQAYKARIAQLEDSLQVSKTNLTTLEENLEEVNEELLKSSEEKNQLLKESLRLKSDQENLTAQISALLEEKKVGTGLVVQEPTGKETKDKVPFVEKVEREYQGPLHQVRVETEAVQRSAAAPTEGTKDRMEEQYEKLSDEYTRLKNKHQVAEVKCEKMLIKLKAFKEKNENLLRELSELKDSQSNQDQERIGSQQEELKSEIQKHQETHNLLLAEQANVAKEKSKIAKMESVFRNKFQEVLDEKNHLSGSCDQLKSKCKELGARLKELLAERNDLQDSIDRLTSEAETDLESARNEHAVERSSLQSKISSLEVECKNTYEDIEDFQKLVGKMKESHEALKSENQKLKDVAHQLKGDLVSSRSVEEKTGHLELEVQGLQEERKSLQDQVEAAREEALANMKELQVARKKLSDVEGKTKLQEEQLGQLKEANEMLESAKWALEADLQASSHQVRCTEQEKATLSEDLAILRQVTANNEILKSELTSVENEVDRKEQSVSLFKREVETLNEQVQCLTSQCRDLESTRQAITVLKKENGSLTEEVNRLNAESAELRSAKEELGVISDRYNNLLQDNMALAKQIEELLMKLQKQGQLEKDLGFAHEQQEHLKREQATFVQRIEDLEGQSQQLTNQNAQLKQEILQVNSALKQGQFEKESLNSQLQVMQSGGDRLSRFQEEYEKLQHQFAQSVEQNNQVQAELNHSTHRLQLREARCQQLAMQVSQLAEDRSYLNIQMGNLSLALREKEKESSNYSSQCKTWYEKHCQLQQKVTDLETSRSEALKLSNSESLTNEIETLTKRNQELAAHQEELTRLNVEQSSQFTSEREQRLLAETNLVQMQEQIKILQQQQMAQDFQIQMDEDQDRILEAQPLLSRHGSSYFHRLQRWLMVKNRQLSRLMRIQPGARTLMRVYFLLLHVIIVALIIGLL